MPNQADRNDYDLGASGDAQANLNATASHLLSLIEQRKADVKQALADYFVDGVSAEYAAKEQRWDTVADEVRNAVTRVMASLQETDGVAADTMTRANQAVQSI